MVPWRSNEAGEVTPEVIAWYERFARGRPGVLVVEATGIRDVPSGPLLRAGNDRFVEGLARLVEAVKRASGGETKLFIQLIDFLAIKRRPPRSAFFSRFLQLTPELRAQFPSLDDAGLRAHLESLDDPALAALLPPRELEALQFGLRERVTDTHLPHISALPQVLPNLFAEAASRCAKAGFDGVELHFAHAYTMASFLSALNTRTDGYGGERANRVRLPLEVFAATRAAVPSSFAVGCRFLADEIIGGGNRADDAAYFGVEFARAGMDFLSLSRGGKFEDAKQPRVGASAYPYTGPSGHECMPTTKMDPSTSLLTNSTDSGPVHPERSRGGLRLRSGQTDQWPVPSMSWPAKPLPPLGMKGGPWGRNVGASAQVKQALVAAGLRTPLVVCGGIATLAQAEAILEKNEADIVASARQSLADPDWLLKLRLGQGAAIRRCLFTNYCEGLDQSHQAVTCQLWDRVKGLPDDETVLRSADRRRLLAPSWER